MSMTYEQNAGQNRKTEMDKESSESARNLKYL
jgi:hypothetical protein